MTAPGSTMRHSIHFALLGVGALVACGGRTSQADGGLDAALDVAIDGPSAEATGPDCTACSIGVSSMSVDPNVCAPQLESTTTCSAGGGCPTVLCSYVVEVPCADDAGAPDAGACETWCAEAAPNGIGPLQPLECHLENGDGGSAYFVTCGGCGV